MLTDIRHAARALRRNPGFAAVAVLTMALGIGANTAMFSVADAVLFKSLPYPEPERIVSIEGAPFAFTKTGMTTPRVLEESRAFAGVGIYANGGLNVGDDGRAERVPAAAVSAGFFPALGGEPIIGRTFTRDEVVAGSRVAVVGSTLWRRHLDADPRLTRPIVLNGQPYVVVGVMPPRYSFPRDSEVWIPTGVDRQITGAAFAPATIARLASGVTPQQGATEVERINDVRRKGPRDPRERPVRVTSLEDELVGDIRPIFSIVGGAVLLVLLVACINTANLLLARVSAREREMSVRRALGASQARLVRYLLCESALISVAAGIVAIPAAFWTLGALTLLLPAAVHGARDIALDGRAAAFTAGLCVLAAVLFGLAPAASLRRRPAAESLRGISTTAGPFWRRFRGGLVALELAAAVILLAGAVTIVQTVRSLLAVDLGARGERAVTLQLTLPRALYGSPEQSRAFVDRLFLELSKSGVEAAGAASTMPGSTEVGVGVRLHVEGLPPGDPMTGTAALVASSPDYFRAIGIDHVAGRTFTPSDNAGAALVAVVSERIPRTLGTSSPGIIGRRINLGRESAPRWAEIVGVVRDVRMRGPERAAAPQVYVPMAQDAIVGTVYLAIKGRTGTPSLSAVQAAVRAVDPALPPYNVRTFDEIRDAYVADRRFAMAVMLAFASLAGVLSVVGLYGVMAYLVQLRTREIGVRVALGATPSRVVRETLASGMTYAGAGVLAGTAAVAMISRVFISRVPGVQQVDLTSLAVTSVLMLVVASATILAPARRAGRVDPVTALRAEG